MPYNAHLLWPGLSPGYRGRTAELICLALGQSSIVVGLALLGKHAITQSSVSPALIFGVFVALVVIGSLLRLRERYAAEQLAVRYVHALRIQMFDALAGPAPVEAGSQAVHTVRFASDLTALRQWITFSMGRLVNGLAMMMAIVTGLWLIDPGIAGLVSVYLTGLFLTTLLVGKRLRLSIQAQRRERGRLTHRIGRVLTQLANLRRTDRLPRERDRLSDVSMALSAAQTRRGFWSGVLRGTSDLAARGSILCVLAYVLFGFADGIAVDVLVVLLLLVSLSSAPLRDLSRLFEYWNAATVARDKLSPLLATHPPSNPTNQPVKQPAPQRRATPGVGISAVTLSNGKQLPAQTLRYGTKVALVDWDEDLLDEVMNLLTADTATPGPISVDNTPLQQLDLVTKAQTMGCVTQAETIVAGSVGKNLRYRMRQPGNQARRHACKTTGFDTLIQRLPQGLSTHIDDCKHLRSSDFDTRLLWTRAIVGTPPLVVLNDIDANLSESGRKQFKAFLRRYPGTVIFATKQSDTALLADVRWQLTTVAPQKTTQIRSTNLEVA